MTINFRRIVSFARRRTHNKAKEDKIIQDIFPKFAVNSGKIDHISDVFNKESKQAYILEIGFGSGENILHRSKVNPQNGYIGCEVFTAGVTKVLESINSDNVNNIRLWHNDALELIPNLPNNSLQLVYILHQIHGLRKSIIKEGL